ncbi:MAG: tyrosine-type recombinase/integrase, partial [Cytophagales bacterium]|nr:tyrosine-type recombinase/integrase [Cytophagales bacterium]
ELYEVATLSEKALLSVYYGCGLRRTEGANLEIRDLKFRSGMLYVRNGKGGRRRGVPMSRQVKEDLLNYIEKERKGNVSELRLFVHQGKGITAGSCSRRFKKLLAKTTIEKEVSLHHLRHSIATHLLERGLSVDYVKEFLGHKSLETTQIYTRVL